MDSFTLTISHLQSPIFYLATVAAGSNLRPPFSIFDLTSGADGWALGSTICILHLLSPHFGPCCCSAICNPQSQSSIFSLKWGTGQGRPDRRGLLRYWRETYVGVPLGSPVLKSTIYPNDLLFLRRDFHNSLFRAPHDSTNAHAQGTHVCVCSYTGTR